MNYTKKIATLAFLICSATAYGTTQNTQKSVLVDVHDVAPSFIIELKYATTDNITDEQVYNSPQCRIHQDLVPVLQTLEQVLEQNNLRLKIWDAYQPPSARDKIWNLVDNDKLVTNPNQPDAHARGLALDVTLCYEDGTEIPMPTKFDNITRKAKTNCDDLPKYVQKHRELLHKIMELHGFVASQDCWWHFEYTGWQNYPVLNEEF